MILKYFWVQLALASDKHASLNEMLVNLDLDIDGNSGRTESVSVELNHHKLQELLASLEQCNKVSDYIPRLPVNC